MDNMPFASSEFRKFAQEWGFKVTTSSPTCPQSNGQSERAVQTIKQGLRIAAEGGHDTLLMLQHNKTWELVVITAKHQTPRSYVINGVLLSLHGLVLQQRMDSVKLAIPVHMHGIAVQHSW